jgi:hypothetical protein
MTRYRNQIKFPDPDAPIELMDAPIGIATTPAGDLAAVIGIVVTVAVLAYLFARLPGALS